MSLISKITNLRFTIFFLFLIITGCVFNSQSGKDNSITQNIRNSFVSNFKTDDTKSFPDDIGWIDVKKDFGAKGDGITDDTEAIKNALAAPHADYIRPKILYFPSGTYLVSDTLQFPKGKNNCCVTLQGQGKNKTVIRLKDNSTSFQDKTQPKAVIKTTGGNMAFRNFFRDLTVSTGKDNRGAIGIDYISNNRGAIINVAIKSEDRYGNTGLSMTRKWPGPSLIKEVEIEGFDYGIHIKRPEYGITFEHIMLKNQLSAGILNEKNTIAIRNLDSQNNVPAIKNKEGFVIIIEGDLRAEKAEVSAIDNDGYLYARDIETTGYKSAINDESKLIFDVNRSEYISDRTITLFDSTNSTKKSLRLPIEETPEYHDKSLDSWANVKDYNSVQAAFDSGKSTIYFPMGIYELDETITVPETVKKIIGFESYINLNKNNLQGVFSIQQDSTEPLIIEGLLLNNVSIDHLSSRTLVIKHTKSLTGAIRNSASSGDLFLENVQMFLNLDNPQNVWARQLNAESWTPPEAKVKNSGGNLWILGIKTEGKGTVIETTKGGKTELLGNLIYPVEKFTEEDKKQPAFINDESSHSLMYSVSTYGANRNYEIQVKEIKNGQTKIFPTSDMQDLKMPLFVGY